MRSSASAGSSPASSGNRACAAPRSSPAENARPEPRTTTTRTSPGSSRPKTRSAFHVAGDCALSTSGRHNVIVATGPARSHRTPAAVGAVMAGTRVHSAPSDRAGLRGAAYGTDESCGGVSRLLAPAGSAALTQLYAGLGQYAVDEAVGAAGGGSQRPDAFAGGVPLDEVLRERLALGSDDPATLFGAGGGAGGCHVVSSRPY